MHSFLMGHEQVEPALVFIDGMMEGTDLITLLRNIQVDSLPTRMKPGDQGTPLDNY